MNKFLVFTGGVSAALLALGAAALTGLSRKVW
jgi:hypothetical protein